jgi:replication factor C subunit 3/5
VAHEDIISIISNLIDNDNLPHLLLYGPPGTGKTSTIVAAAKKMYGDKAYSSMALELNASDARGIDVSSPSQWRIDESSSESNSLTQSIA